MTEQKLDKVANNLVGLIKVFRLMGSKSKDACIKESLLDPKFLVLMFLSKGELPMNELGKRLQRSKPNMTTLIDSLIKEGKVQRESDKTDRRVVLIKITQKGKDYLESKKDEIKNNVKANLMNIRKEEIDKLSQSLEEVNRILLTIRGEHYDRK
jgi:DNA-binding MarR family transcriptional regulator